MPNSNEDEILLPETVIPTGEPEVVEPVEDVVQEEAPVEPPAPIKSREEGRQRLEESGFDLEEFESRLVETGEIPEEDAEKMAAVLGIPKELLLDSAPEWKNTVEANKAAQAKYDETVASLNAATGGDYEKFLKGLYEAVTPDEAQAIYQSLQGDLESQTKVLGDLYAKHGKSVEQGDLSIILSATAAEAPQAPAPEAEPLEEAPTTEVDKYSPEVLLKDNPYSTFPVWKLTRIVNENSKEHRLLAIKAGVARFPAVFAMYKKEI